MLRQFKMMGITVILLGVATGISHADKLQEVLDRGYLIAGTGSTNAPWHFKDENNELVGFDIDMLGLIVKGLFSDPAKIEFVNQGDARIPNLATDKVDITCQFMTGTAS
ncbi:MAG: transporter substrate-binding domain-containing protein [Paracoccaceae bacterium]|nr:transporter substrate-binding domain-containing protein [Paracoccaceae bacterium]MDE2674869.1 transporter substrate-binding domain-containing protein [Paracoccaceae bacterium]